MNGKRGKMQVEDEVEKCVDVLTINTCGSSGWRPTSVIETGAEIKSRATKTTKGVSNWRERERARAQC